LTKAIVSTELSKMPQPKAKEDGSFEVDDLDLDDL